MSRQMPCAIEAEQSVLGGLMIANASLPKVSDWLTPEDFYRDDHRAVYRAILALSVADQPFDVITVAEWLAANGHGDRGSDVMGLAMNTASAANIVAYAEIVADKALLRRMIDAGTKIAESGFAPDGRDTRQLVSEAGSAVAALGDWQRASGVQDMGDVSRDWLDELTRRFQSGGALLGLPTPWAKFNRMTAGLKPGELIVVAGRPSMGKSAFAVNIATANALSGKRVLFFNLEMTAASIFNRAVASIAEVPLKWLRAPGDDGDYWDRAAVGAKKMKGAQLLIDDTPGLGRAQILARSRREHMRQPLDLVIIDHLHLMPLEGKTRETVEIGNITRDMKGLSKELDCPVILLSQLNRSLESRAGSKRPVMADLRESGNIEQDADLIVFLYRDDYYADREGRGSEFPGFVEIIIGKQREGEAGKVWARDRLAYGLIDDYEGDEPESNKPKATKRANDRWSGVARSEA